MITVSFKPDVTNEPIVKDFWSALAAEKWIEAENGSQAFRGWAFRYVPISPTTSELRMMAFEESLAALNEQIEAERPKSTIETYANGGGF